MDSAEDTPTTRAEALAHLESLVHDLPIQEGLVESFAAMGRGYARAGDLTAAGRAAEAVEGMKEECRRSRAEIEQLTRQLHRPGAFPA